MNILLETTKSKLCCIDNFADVNYFTELNNLDLNIKPEIKIMGKICHQQRDVAFYSDESEGYRYSGQLAKAKSLSSYPILEKLLLDTNKVLGTTFNGILVNRYVDGSNYISAHSDDESALDQNNKMVASIAFGAIRNFRIRDKNTKKIVIDYPHKPGTLLIMKGDFQSEYTHEIPKQLRIKDSRISVTFRYHTK